MKTSSVLDSSLRLLDPAQRPAPEFLRGEAEQLLIDGVWVPAQSGETAETIDPTTEKVLTRFAMAGPGDVDLAVAAARRAFEDRSWSNITPYARSLVLLQIADVIEAHREALATLDSPDMGAPLVITHYFVDHAVEVFQYWAGWPTKIYGQTGPSDSGQLNYTLRQPVGVVGDIMARNGPMHSMSWKLAPALAAGNTVVLKPAEQTPLSALRLAELLLETDLPRGVVNIVTGGGRTAGEALTTRPALVDLGLRHSTGRTGICYDNAMAESFFAALKNERVHRTVYPTRAHAIRDITRYIDAWYNTERLHSGLGYQTPSESHAGYRATA